VTSSWKTPATLPGGILAALIRPLITPFVVDLPLGEQPFPINLHQLVLIVPEPVEDALALRVVVGVPEDRIPLEPASWRQDWLYMRQALAYGLWRVGIPI
jgi:hypothetical protein